MNHFGGNWTEDKIEILVEYAKAYLKIMNPNAEKFDWKLLYFDGFAGSGEIKKGNDEDEKIIIGAAKRILEIDNPRAFDMYYFVEKEEANVDQLKVNTVEKFPHKDIKVVAEDCNNKIHSMSGWLKNEGKKYKVLAYIDPCGMQLNWNSLEALGDQSVDVWILVPTGLGVNRLLKNDGEISKAWLEKLESFLGMSQEDILSYFYKKETKLTLFGDQEVISKTEQAVERSAELYKKRLNDLFKYVSEPYVLRNKTNSIMFHFLMATNNNSAAKVATEIVSKYNKKN